MTTRNWVTTLEWSKGMLGGALLCALLASVACAAPNEGVYRAGDNRALTVSATADNSFEFSLAIGAADGEGMCTEGDVSCLSITGAAEASADGYTYVDPDGEGSITFEVKDEDIVISKAVGSLGSGSGNAQQLNWIAGVYELPAQRDYISFQTPSGNIGCAIWPGKDGELRCDIKELQQSFTAKPDDCEFSWGSAFELKPLGKGQVICFNDTAFNSEAIKLEYGKTLNVGGFRCLSEKTGLTCKNGAGHGFTLSKARQKLF